MSTVDIGKFPHSHAAMKALLLALADDGLPSAGLVVSAVPLGAPGEAAKEPLVLTALRDDVRLGSEGEMVPTSPVMALFEQALKSIRRCMAERGS